MHYINTSLHWLARRSIPLIGRDADMAALGQLLQQPHIRLISLLGPGGVGKTSLALALLAAHQSNYTNGVAFVDLSPFTNPADILPALANALDLKEQPGQLLAETIQTYLQPRQLLLCCDNFEHLIIGAEQIDYLLQTCPGLTVLTTTRQPLRLRGEQEYSVSPLATPDPSALSADPQALANFPAATLFVTQAQRVRPDFALTTDNATAIAALCIHLDGLPLALELAAARIKLFSSAHLLAQWRSGVASLHLLSGGPRNAPLRQQTLYNTIAWSYGLLPHHEQVLFRHLSVFAGGFTLSAATALCRRILPQTDPFEGVASLVDKSLVQALHPDSTLPEADAHFIVLETIRTFALEQLTSAELINAHQVHAEYYLSFAEKYAMHDGSIKGNPQIERLHSNRENIYVALDWALADDAPPARRLVGLRLAAALGDFWHLGGHFTEGAQWLKRAVAQANPVAIDTSADPDQIALEATLYSALGTLCWAQGAYPQAVVYHQASLLRCRYNNDPAGIGFALNNLAVQQGEQGCLQSARELFKESLAIYRQHNNLAGVGVVLNNMGAMAEVLGDNAAAETYYNEALHYHQQRGNRLNTAAATFNLGEIARRKKRLSDARLYYRKAISLAEPLGYQPLLCVAHIQLGIIALQMDDWSQALASFSVGLPLATTVGYKKDLEFSLFGLAQLALQMERPALAVQSLAAVYTLHHHLNTSSNPDDEAAMGITREQLRQLLGQSAFQTAWAQGETADPATLIETALAQLTHPAKPSPLDLPPSETDTTHPLTVLTRRETDVARLVAYGLTNREIAAELNVVAKTVEKHLANVMTKINCKNRAEVAAKIAATGLKTPKK